MTSADLKCRELLYCVCLNLTQGDLLQEITGPLKAFLSGASTDEVVMLNISEILSHMVAKDSGMKFILRGNYYLDNDCSHFEGANPRDSLLELVAQFVKKCLECSDYSTISMQILGSFIYFLRQCYRSCEGLNQLQQFNLHESLAPKIRHIEKIRGDLSEIEVIALDNLLNFSATPKGVMLLEKSGSIYSCVAYMFYRFILIKYEV